MLTLRIRKLVLLALIALIVIMGNLMAIAAWLSQTGAIDIAQHIRKEYLTGTAITILIALLVLLVGPARSRVAGANCPVCDHPQHSGHYCKQCGSARA